MNSRRYKVSIYLDIPFDFNNHLSSDELGKVIENKLSETFRNSIIEVECSKQPLPEIHDIEYIDNNDMEDILSFKHPVGFIAPDGLFYGMESNELSWRI